MMEERLDSDTAKELITVLSYCNDAFVSKIPNNVICEIRDIAADSKEDYFIDESKDLLSQELSNGCLNYISYLYLEYYKDN